MWTICADLVNTYFICEKKLLTKGYMTRYCIKKDIGDAAEKHDKGVSEYLRYMRIV